MRQYLDLLRRVYEAPARKDRTGTGTSGIFGHQMTFNLLEGFPMLSTKSVWFKGVVDELLWMLAGDTNAKTLSDKGVHIWDDWAAEDGSLGPVYGAQWRSWEGSNGVVVDQIKELIHELHSNPFSRRLVVSAWNVAELSKMALPPCHCLFQFYVQKASFVTRLAHWANTTGNSIPGEMSPDQILAMDKVMDEADIPVLSLSCKLYQRSADVFLGVPFNIASYSLLTHMIAHCVGMIPETFIWSGGDCHLYSNHREQAKLQLSRMPGGLPKLEIKTFVKDLFSLRAEDFVLSNYNPQAAIKAPVSV